MRQRTSWGLMVQQILPTTLEFGLASGVLLYYYGWPYLVTLAITMTAYSLFIATGSSSSQNRSTRQKTVDFVMNDSLTNFETVK